MDTDIIKVYDLFEKQRRFFVPIYQRGYVWTREDQWEPLWEDIKDQADSLRDSGDRTGSGIKKHFLGAIVLVPIPVVFRQVPSFEVIDGQQRLLTLQALLAALRDATSETDNEYAAGTLGRLTRNPGPFWDAEEVYKVWPTQAYQGALRAIMETSAADNLANQYPQKLYYRKLVPPRPALVEAYLYFHDQIARYVRGIDEESDEINAGHVYERQVESSRAEDLIVALTQTIQLVSITLDAEDDPQVIFETLNSRGVPLEPSDLIRNFLFLSAARRHENSDQLYQQFGSGFDSENQKGQIFWKEKERQGRLRRSRHDLFLFHYLTYQTASEHKITHVFQDFKAWWSDEEPGRSINSELESIQRFSSYFRGLIEPDRATRLGRLGARLTAIDTTTVYPLLLWLCEHSSVVSSIDFDGMVTDLESYLVRRMICGLTSKNYNRVFLSILSTLRKGGSPSRSALQAELLSLAGDSSFWPDDVIFRQSLNHSPVYQKIGTSRVRMVLEAIEAASRTDRQEETAFVKPLTVEHVLPQKWQEEDWPLSKLIVDKEKEARLRGIALHTLGNLTLLTRPLNSSVSRGPFSGKRPDITSQSLLKMNSYFQKFDDSDTWNESTITLRGAILADTAISIWPHPMSA